MAACRSELTVEAARASPSDPTFVIEAEGAILGFYQLRPAGTAADIRMFFVAPEAVRSGLGRRLWAHLERTARAAGDAPRGRQRSACRRLLSRDGHAPHGPGGLGRHRRAHAAASREGSCSERPSIPRPWLARQSRDPIAGPRLRGRRRQRQEASHHAQDIRSANGGAAVLPLQPRGRGAGRTRAGSTSRARSASRPKARSQTAPRRRSSRPGATC